MTLLEERQKRIDDAIALREPDRVPITVSGSNYAVVDAGYTLAEAMYDFDKAADAAIKFLNKYQPDAGGWAGGGRGAIMELIRPKTLAWPGAPDGRIPDNVSQQFIEFVVLQEEDMGLFMEDYTGWLLTKGFPAISGLLEPLAEWDFARYEMNSYANGFMRMISTPASRKMIQTIWKIDDMSAEMFKKGLELNKKLVEMGFPTIMGGQVNVPFDSFSNFYRGTLDTMMDLFDHPEVIKRFIDRNIDYVLENITAFAKANPGKWLFMALHKGMDTFLSDEQYADYYWKHLRRMIHHIIDVGMVPFAFCEGKYNTRLKYLSDVPKGKAVFYFESSDPVAVKQHLNGNSCIQGLFPSYLLQYGKKQEVIDEAKRLIDILAPGGGYIFNVSAGTDNAKPENMEAMFDTVKTYGKK